MTSPGRAVITGASAGIGAATARALGAAGFEVVLGARRTDALEGVAHDVGGTAIELDVTDQRSVDRFVEQAGDVRVLVNNAGGAFGRDTVAEADADRWRAMYEVNVLGTLRMTK